MTVRGGYPNLRYKKTMQFLKETVPPGEHILDLGTHNLFSVLMEREGYRVSNTGGEDLDTDYHSVDQFNTDYYSSFELFEHLFAPFNILSHIKRGHLVVSVPLKVWFARAYWNSSDKRDCHYHEFEPRQFNRLLERTGWHIIRSERWASPDRLRPGIRPLLRFIWPGYYFVYAVKNSDHA